MRRHPWLTRAVADAGIGLSAALAAGDAAITVRGDPAAWTALNAALTKLRALPGWREKEIGPDGAVYRTIKFAPPNFHMTDSKPAGPSRSSTRSAPPCLPANGESIVTAKHSAVKMGGGGAPSGWQCVKAFLFPSIRAFTKWEVETWVTRR